MACAEKRHVHATGDFPRVFASDIASMLVGERVRICDFCVSLLNARGPTGI